MKRNIAILSGVSGRVTEGVSQSLHANQIDPVFVKYTEPSEDYIRRLNLRTLEVVKRLEDGAAMRALLFSSLDGLSETLENRTFFPALQRFIVPQGTFSDINKRPNLIAFITDAFKSDSATLTGMTLKRRFSHLKLPLRNCGLPKTRNSFLEVYQGAASDVSRSIVKQANIMNGDRGIRIKGLNFKPVVNNSTHPVRRICDDPICDLGAKFRFGVSMADRLEFDVSSNVGLAGKTFCLCDGRQKLISNQATHLNLRVNDDFAEG